MGLAALVDDTEPERDGLLASTEYLLLSPEYDDDESVRGALAVALVAGRRLALIATGCSSDDEESASCPAVAFWAGCRPLDLDLRRRRRAWLFFQLDVAERLLWRPTEVPSVLCPSVALELPDLRDVAEDVD